MNKKEAIREFKERKTPRGIFAIRCVGPDRVWVGASRNLNAAKNGYWFGLRTGNHQDKSLQAEWKARGEEAFSYDVLETVDEDVHPMELADLLKSKQVEWILRLGAGKLL
jgi:hypothetical protein